MYNEMNKNKIKLNDTFLEEHQYIFKKFKPLKKIGVGGCGNIYSVMRLNDESIFAMKIEKLKTRISRLESEAYFLFILQGYGIPKFISFGHTKKYFILIETLLDKSLFNIFIENKKICNLKDICLIGLQILDRLEWIHSKGILYNDIKPQNFLFGIKDPNVIYIIDFGLCKKYRSSKTGKHILPRKTGIMKGTLNFASPNVIKGKEPSRRDDIISLGYLLIYLYKRELPWLDVMKKKTDINKNNYNKLINLKCSNGNGLLFKNIPDELIEYIKYARNLKFEQDPDYSYLRSLFNKIISKNNMGHKSLSFSWNKINNINFNINKRRSNSRKKNFHSRLLKSIENDIQKRILSNSNINYNTQDSIYNETYTNKLFSEKYNFSSTNKVNTFDSIKTEEKRNINIKNINKKEKEKEMNSNKNIFKACNDLNCNLEFRKNNTNIFYIHSNIEIINELKKSQDKNKIFNKSYRNNNYFIKKGNNNSTRLNNGDIKKKKNLNYLDLKEDINYKSPLTNYKFL